MTADIDLDALKPDDLSDLVETAMQFLRYGDGYDHRRNLAKDLVKLVPSLTKQLAEAESALTAARAELEQARAEIERLKVERGEALLWSPWNDHDVLFEQWAKRRAGAGDGEQDTATTHTYAFSWDGDTLWLECDPCKQRNGEWIVCSAEPGDTWDELVEAVADHKAAFHAAPASVQGAADGEAQDTEDLLRWRTDAEIDSHIAVPWAELRGRAAVGRQEVIVGRDGRVGCRCRDYGLDDPPHTLACDLAHAVPPTPTQTNRKS